VKLGDEMMRSSVPKQSSFAGFTIVEALVAVVIIGILAAIAVPSWQKLITNQRVSRAQEEAYQAFREARFNAEREKRPWQVQFRQNNNRVEFDVHATNNNPNWQSLTNSAEQIAIDNCNNTNNNNFVVQFQGDGTVDETNIGCGGNAGSLRVGISFIPSNQQQQSQPQPIQCVYVETILGALRQEEGTANCP
jgi:prepilin-type N-terminal cleavage/methylation domain-containing protein